jgi:hypothetical protein
VPHYRFDRDDVSCQHALCTIEMTFLRDYPVLMGKR